MEIRNERSLWAVAIGAAAVLVAPRAFAHDFWIEPSVFRADPGELINVHLRVGHAFEGDPVARQSQRIEKFVVSGPDGEKDLPGVDGGDPAGFVRPRHPGVYVVGYRSRHARSELDAATFESYLREEGLERIIELRGARGESSEPGRELYSRCAKSIVLVGENTDAQPPGAGAACDHVLGLRLELIPPADLLARAPGGGDSISFQLLFDGQPIEGVLVHACNRSESHRELKARTDKEGRVSFAVDRDGAWMLNAVHMIEAPPEATSAAAPAATPHASANAEWESLWTSLTFELLSPAAER